MNESKILDRKRLDMNTTSSALPKNNQDKEGAYRMLGASQTAGEQFGILETVFDGEGRWTYRLLDCKVSFSRKSWLPDLESHNLTISSGNWRSVACM